MHLHGNVKNSCLTFDFLRRQAMQAELTQRLLVANRFFSTFLPFGLGEPFSPITSRVLIWTSSAMNPNITCAISVGHYLALRGFFPRKKKKIWFCRNPQLTLDFYDEGKISPKKFSANK
jgi:hypothetical protein